MEEGIDFKFRDDLAKEQTDTVPIELLLDFYKGIVYRYTSMKVIEQDDQAVMKFDYEFIDTGNLQATNLRKDKQFHNIIGLILNKLILDTVEYEQTKEDYNAGRTDDTQEYIEES